MVCQTEKDFVEVLLATLCSMGKKEIPFDNEDFTKGFLNASNYFYAAAINPALKEKITPLFIKQTTYGEYLRMQGVIEDMNGRIISLKNPHFISATINMDNDYIHYLLKNKEPGLSDEFFEGLAVAFCEGANI